MNQHAGFDAIEARLRAVALSPAASDQVATQAEELLARLTSPVRVGLLGLPDAGKPALLNALLGEPIVPESGDLPTIEVRYGIDERAQITLPDGTVEERTGPIDLAAMSRAILVVIERPRPMLRRISLLSVMADSSVQDQRAATSWAARRSDIGLWCSREFSKTDAMLLAGLPGTLRDHSYLVLTDCDEDRASEVKDVCSETVLDVYSLDLSDAAREAGETGAGALAERILSHAAMGRQADADSALLFLRANESELPQAGLHPGKATDPQTDETIDATPAPEADPEEASAIVATLPERPVTRSVGSAHRAVYSAGLGLLRGLGAELLEAANEGAPPGDIPGRCSEALQNLSSLLEEQDDDENGQLSELIDMIYEAESIVILMENENQDTAPADAISILQQVRLDLEHRLAA